MDFDHVTNAESKTKWKRVDLVDLVVNRIPQYLCYLEVGVGFRRGRNKEDQLDTELNDLEVVRTLGETRTGTTRGWNKETFLSLYSVSLKD